MSRLAVALVVGFPIGSGFYQRRKLALASHVDTLAEFATEMPNLRRLSYSRRMAHLSLK
jgi:hypothetical protein